MEGKIVNYNKELKKKSQKEIRQEKTFRQLLEDTMLMTVTGNLEDCTDGFTNMLQKLWKKISKYKKGF